MKYKEDGQSIEEGFECWPFVRFCFAQMCVVLPEDIYEARMLFREVPKTDPYWKPLDVVYCSNDPLIERHVGVKVDRRMMLHCSLATNGVARSEITRDPWRLSVRSIWRLKAFDS